MSSSVDKREEIVDEILQEFKKNSYRVFISVSTEDGSRDLVDIDKVTSGRIRVNLKVAKEKVNIKGVEIEKKSKVYGYQLFDFDPSEFKWEYNGCNRHYLDVEMLASLRFDKEIKKGFNPMPKKYVKEEFNPYIEKFNAYFSAPIKCEIEMGKSLAIDSEFIPLGRKILFVGIIKLSFEIHPTFHRVYVGFHEVK